jgi:nucleoside phosphorylase
MGLAGGLDPQLKTGDAVIYDQCFRAQADPNFDLNSKEKRLAREEKASIVCDPHLSTRLFESMHEAGLSCARGAGLTIKRVVFEAEQKLALKERYGTIAVDMETYEIMAVCARLGLPAAALRVVMDRAGDDLPDFNRGLKADGSLNLWRLLPALLARPGPTARFFLNLRPALRGLRAAACTGLRALRLRTPDESG